MVEGVVLCAVTQRIKVIKKKRCMKIEEEEAIEEVDVSIFQSKESRIREKSTKTDQQLQILFDAKRNKIVRKNWNKIQMQNKRWQGEDN